MDERKPAIIASSNTTRSIPLGTRKPKQKKYEPPKKFIPKKRTEKSAKHSEKNDSIEMKKLIEIARDSQASALNISVEKNLTFDDLDEEFYEIMRQKLKVDIKEKKTGADAEKADEDLGLKVKISGELKEAADTKGTQSKEEIVKEKILDAERELDNGFVKGTAKEENEENKQTIVSQHQQPSYEAEIDEIRETEEKNQGTKENGVFISGMSEK